MGGAYDAVIIGGGPAGLTAAIYASRLGLKTIVSDKSGADGALGSASRIENFPGVNRAVTGGELLSILREQAEAFGSEFLPYKADAAELNADPKIITAGGRLLEAKTVVIATGSMGRAANIKGEAEFAGKGVSYCAACDAPFFRGKDVALIGSAEKILEELHTISPFAGRIYAVTPSRLTSGKQQHEELRENAEVFEKHAADEIFGDEFVSGLKIKDSTGTVRDIPVSGVFIYLRGNSPEVDFIKEEIRLGDDGCIQTDPGTMETSIKGVYAAGDVTCKEFRQAVVAAAEGCKAALSAEGFLSKRKKPRHSWH